jgi:maltokinase
MVLVEGLTGFAAASYATDPALLAELRAAWPVADDRGVITGVDENGFRPTDLAHAVLDGAILLTDRLAVAMAVDAAGDGSYIVIPLVREGGRWRSARAGDGLSAFVAGVPMASERAIGVDQTNESVVVGERVIVKWFRRVGPGPSRAATLIAHLNAVGFGGMPPPLGSVTWRSPGGVDLTLAQGDAFLPGARDGWEWCVELVPDDASIGSALGELVGRLHHSLATPSAVIGEPVASAAPADVARWRQEALAALEQARATEPSLEPLVSAMRRVLDELPSDRLIAIQPVHGDLHVGQVLGWPGGFSVIDFDGNPAIGSEANAVRQPRERDIAQMLMSLDHVGRIVDHRSGWTMTVTIDAWIAATRAGFLAATGPVDEEVLAAFEVEQECREVLYASRFLPRWRYAPMATLEARFPAR